MEIFKKASYISGGNFMSLKNKKKETLKFFFMFYETKRSSPKLTKISIFKDEKSTKFLCSSENVFLHCGITADEVVK